MHLGERGLAVLSLTDLDPRLTVLPAARSRDVLVVDDSRAQRHILAMLLHRWGYRVTEAATGADALALCRAKDFDIILSDWMMPGLTGPEFCRAFRGLPREDYGYFVLLTAKSDKAEVAVGLEAGADDFLTKPVNPDELRARLRAGERILGMHSELVEKNRLIGTKMQELRQIYDSLDRDLIEAKKLQQTLVRDRHRDLGAAAVTLLLQPSGHVGGDLVGAFRINADKLALYAVDVSGHGVASAMMTARLSGLLTAGSPDQNIALMRDGQGGHVPLPPQDVAARLNRLMIDDLKVDQYFTMIYAEVDLPSGAVRLVQAGHPHPVLLRASGAASLIGTGGFPIGLLAEAEFRAISFQMMPGDRLVIASDGFTECPGKNGDLGEAGLQRILLRTRHLSGPALDAALMSALSAHTAGAEFPDDVSAVILDYRGPVPRTPKARASIARSPGLPSN
jgi:phosphoserine phosphatase RsbU/P